MSEILTIPHGHQTLGVIKTLPLWAELVPCPELCHCPGALGISLFPELGLSTTSKSPPNEIRIQHFPVPAAIPKPPHSQLVLPRANLPAHGCPWHHDGNPGINLIYLPISSALHCSWTSLFPSSRTKSHQLQRDQSPALQKMYKQERFR